ncbi:MAG: hypothetical protein FJY82_03040 [Candidatus Aminicenantes bacterium]|nr:hypothetical protein [Candidatus Aminicenantes bacterium]
MKALKTLALGTFAALGLIGLVFGATTVNQTVTMQISQICLVGVSGNPAALNVTAPATAGDQPSNPSDNATYARYTSVIPSGQTRKLQVNWGGSDAAPAGCSLKLTAAPQSGKGTTAGQKTVSATAQDIVTGIGSCATGTGGTDGAQLTYVLSIDDFASLIQTASTQATITLTLTDAS